MHVIVNACSWVANYVAIDLILNNIAICGEFMLIN